MRHLLLSHRFVLLLVLLMASILHTQPSQAQNKIYRYTHMGNQRFAANNPDGAINYYLKVLHLSPHNSRAMFNLADSYLTKGNVKAADSLYARVTQVDNNPQIRAMSWHNRGYISQTAAMKSQEQEQNLLRQAIEQYKQSLRLNPRDNRTRYNLALCQKLLRNNPNNNKQNNPQQNKQNKQQNNQQQQNKNNNPQQNKNNNGQTPPKQPQQDKQQTQQYINLAKQAEKRALEKLKQHQPRQRSLEKNW